MRRTIIILFGIISAIICQAQKLDISVDDFTGDIKIKTSWEKIYSGGMTGKDQTRIQIQQINGSQFILFRVFTDRVVSIDKGAEVMFKTTDGIIKATVQKYAISEHGAWAPNAVNNKLGIYFTSRVDLNQISGKIEKIRIPLNDGNLDLTIKSKDSDKIAKMISEVLNANVKR